MVRWHVGFGHAAGVGARRMQEGAPGSARAFDDFFGENLEIVGIVVILFADHFDETGPAAAQTDHLVSLLQRAAGDAANRGIQTRDVSSAGENSDYALLGVDVSH